MNKAVLSALSALLVVGVAIGCIAIVRRDGSSNEHSGGAGGGNNEHVMSTQTKAVTNICQPTTYKDDCTKSLASAKSDDPKDLIKAAVASTQEALKNANKFTDNFIAEKIKGKDESQKKALEYCKQMLDSGIEDLQDFLDTVETEDSINLNNKFYDLWSWVSSTFSYQGSCLDDLFDDVRDQMHGGMYDARKLTSNAMAIVKNINEIMSSFGLNLSINMTSPDATSRRLLETDQDADDAFPTWVTNDERKLLQTAEVKPNAVVAQDGSGQYKTIMAALAAYNPPKNAKVTEKYVIYVKEGTYREQVIVSKKQPNVFIYGDGPTRTNITNRLNVGIDKLHTSGTGTLLAFGAGFMVKSLGLYNTAGPAGGQAVALMIQGDKSIVHNCRLDGYQDTLYCNTGRQFYSECYITGTVDFIFGKSATVIQNSVIAVRKGGPGQGNMVTADGKEDKNSLGGIVIQNCSIIPHESILPTMATTKSFLGRPWKNFSTTVFMENDISEVINPVGWSLWDGSTNHLTCIYKEFKNRGLGSTVETRVKWAKIVTDPNQVVQYTAGRFLGLTNEPWLAGTGVPFSLGFTR